MRIKLESLQVYRGLAALGVVFYHVTEISHRTFDFSFFSGFFSEGGRGVDFFFLLSGFIIFFIHNKDIGRPDKAKRYILKRFFRIYPILFIMLSFKLIYLTVTGAGTHAAEMNIDTIVSSYLLLIPDSGRYLVAVAWTLSYEVFFYTVFLICILMGRRASVSILSLWFLLIVIVNVLFKGQLGLLSSFVLNPINVLFLFGCLAGYLFQERKLESYCWLLLTLGVMGLVLGFSYSDMQMDIIYKRFLWAIVFFSLVLGTVYIEQKVKAKPPKMLSIIGDASYSIYLVHSSIQAVLLKIYVSAGVVSYGYPQLMMLIFGIASVIGGLVFWFFIERPIQSKSYVWINKSCST